VNTTGLIFSLTPVGSNRLSLEELVSHPNGPIGVSIQLLYKQVSGMFDSLTCLN